MRIAVTITGKVVEVTLLMEGVIIGLIVAGINVAVTTIIGLVINSL